MEFARSADEALQRISDLAGESLILILSDINMTGMSGLEMLPKAKAARPEVPVIMITPYGDDNISASESRSLTKATRLRRPLWVKSCPHDPKMGLPLFPQQRTSSAEPAMSEKCQKRKCSLCSPWSVTACGSTPPRPIVRSDGCGALASNAQLAFGYRRLAVSTCRLPCPANRRRSCALEHQNVEAQPNA